MIIGIIGNGFVGQATKVLECKAVQMYVYDIKPELCFPKDLNLKDMLDECDIIFISVPTPMNKDGSCHLNILESVIHDIEKCTI